MFVDSSYGICVDDSQSCVSAPKLLPGFQEENDCTVTWRYFDNPTRLEQEKRGRVF
jgi:hypothetical protein